MVVLGLSVVFLALSMAVLGLGVVFLGLGVVVLGLSVSLRHQIFYQGKMSTVVISRYRIHQEVEATIPAPEFSTSPFVSGSRDRKPGRSLLCTAALVSLEGSPGQGHGSFYLCGLSRFLCLKGSDPQS